MVLILKYTAQKRTIISTRRSLVWYFINCMKLRAVNIRMKPNVIMIKFLIAISFFMAFILRL